MKCSQTNYLTSTLTASLLLCIQVVVIGSIHATELERFTLKYRYDSGFNKKVEALTYSPDGKWLAAVTAGHIDLIDTATGDLVKQFGGSAYSVAFTGDSRKLLAIASGSRTHIDLQTLRPQEVDYQLPDGYLGVTFTEKNGKVLIASITPEGPVATSTKLAVGDELTAICTNYRTGKLRVYGAKQATSQVQGPAGMFVSLYAIPQGEFDEVEHVVRRLAGEIRGNTIHFQEYRQPTLSEHLALTSRDGWFEFSNAATANPLQWIRPQDISHFGQFAISPDKKRFAMVSRTKGNSGSHKTDSGFAVEVFDLTTAQRIAFIPHLKRSHYDIQFSPECDKVLVGTWDSIEVMDIASERTTYRLNLGWEPSPPNEEDRPSGDLGVVAGAAADDAAFGQTDHTKSPNMLLNCMAPSALGFAAVGTNQGEVKLWELQSGKLLHTIRSGSATDKIELLQVSRQGDRLTFYQDGVLHLMRVKDLKAFTRQNLGRVISLEKQGS